MKSVSWKDFPMNCRGEIDPVAVLKWKEAFEKRHSDFYLSSWKVENWLVDHELPNHTEVARAIRVFIKEEVLGEDK
jgi:hypothetical protein